MKPITRVLSSARRVFQGRERQLYALTRLFASARRCSTSPKMLTLEAWATFGPERSFIFVSETWDYLFLGLLAFTVDLTEPLELTFVLGLRPLSAFPP
jgi:hypothetical protein